MYFEPTKKTYYRFPSSSSTQDFEARYYYPNQSKALQEDSRFESGFHSHTNLTDAHYKN